MTKDERVKELYHKIYNEMIGIACDSSKCHPEELHGGFKKTFVIMSHQFAELHYEIESLKEVVKKWKN